MRKSNLEEAVGIQKPVHHILVATVPQDSRVVGFQLMSELLTETINSKITEYIFHIL